jgi:hypothetical protein
MVATASEIEHAKLSFGADMVLTAEEGNRSVMITIKPK